MFAPKRLLVLTAVLGAISAPTHAQTLINEVLASTTGTDVEFIELIGAADTSLGGLSLVVAEGESNANQGRYTFRFDFSTSDALGDNGYLLLGNARVAASYGVTANIVMADNALQNGSETVALVATASLSGDAVAGGEMVLDAVALAGPAASLPDSIFYFGAPVVGPDGSFFPAGARRVTDGVDTNTAADWLIADFDLGPANTPTSGNFPPPPVLSLSIPTIQGNGRSSPYVDRSVQTEGIVVGDFQAGGRGSDGSANGFYLQDETGDADAASSDGIFVFDGFSPGVDVQRGDRVRVTGNVTEYFGETQIGATQVEVLAAGAVADVTALAQSVALPTANAIANADGKLIGDLEPYEGMLVRFAQALTVSEYFNLDRFGEIRLTEGGRLFQFTQDHSPDALGYAGHLNEVATRTLMLDDGLTVQNPDPIRYPAPGLNTNHSVRGGDRLTNLIGVVRYSRGSGGSGDETYRLLPIVEPLFVALNTRPATPPPVGGRLKAASFNVLNYFNTLDDGSAQCGPPQSAQECRGADAEFGVTELLRQTDKLVTAIVALDADILGLIEIENDYADRDASSIATLLDAVNERLGSEIYDYVDPGVPYLGSDAIAVGIAYKRAAVKPATGSSVALLDDSKLSALGLADRIPLFDGPATSRVPLAASFEDRLTGGAFTVVVNHFKSKGQSGLDDPSDPNFDQADGQGFWNRRRSDAALALKRWLAQDPTHSRDPDIVLLGDLNAYAMEEPVAVLLEAGYRDPLDRYSSAQRYSYVFDGQLGTLDYALSSESLYAQIDGASLWAINADEVDGLDYNLDFGRPAGIFDGSVPYRSSDHDPVVLGFSPFARGDFDGDGRLSLARDLHRVLLALHSRRGQSRYDASLDLDLDSRIDARDLLSWLYLYKQSRHKR
jgi:hypothetical protein